MNTERLWFGSSVVVFVPRRWAMEKIILIEIIA